MSWKIYDLSKLPLKQLIRRMETAPDFGYDDEEEEMGKRGIKFKWDSHNKIILL